MRSSLAPSIRKGVRLLRFRDFTELTGTIRYLDFNAYHVAALNTSADAFLHLGDYVSNIPRFKFIFHVSLILSFHHVTLRFTSRWVTGKELFRPFDDREFYARICRAKIGRQTLGRELATIHDYRQRLNQYRTDVGLKTAHETGPWITVWFVHLTHVVCSTTDSITG